MPEVRVVVTGYNLITPYGLGVFPIWKGLLSKKTRIKNLRRFSIKSSQGANAASVPGLNYLKGKSLAFQMLRKVFTKNNLGIPKDSFLILATTVGEIEILERYVLSGKGNVREASLVNLLKKSERLAKVKASGIVLSCACASSSAAIAQAAALIRSGKKDSVLVVAVDSVSEFVYSGFSSLMALDKKRAKPFDKYRSGLSLGEAAGFILLMSEERAKKEGREIKGEISGWGLSCDANHITGPSRAGSGLSKAILKALKSAQVSPSDIGCISAHGTGTIYNDSMEIKAFKKIYKKSVPIYSIKGAIGHTLGAAGLIEAIVALKVLQEKIIPATVGLENVDQEAKGLVYLFPRKLKKDVVMLNNCGFGGINAALVLRNYD